MATNASKSKKKKELKLLQVKVSPKLKKDLEMLADYKGISTSAFVKLTLTEGVRNGKRQLITENGLTVEEEMEVLKMTEESMKAHKEGRTRRLSYDELIEALESDVNTGI